MKFEKQRMYIVVSAIFLLGLLIGVSFSQMTSLTTFHIQGGIYPGGPSYTIWKEGSNYFAKNAYGAIDYSGTNASQIWQSVIDVLTISGTIFVKAGTYFISAPIQFSTVLNYGYSPIPIEVIGESGTVLNWTGSNGAVFTSKDTTEYVSHLTLKNLEIHGNGKVADGIAIRNLYASTIENVVIEDCHIGVRLNASSGRFCNENTLINVITRQCNYGFYLGSTEANANSLISCKSYGNELSALTIAWHAFFNTIIGGDYSNTASNPNINIIGNATHHANMNKFYGVFSESGSGASIKVYVDVTSNFFYGLSCEIFMCDGGIQYWYGGQVTTINGATPQNVNCIDVSGYVTQNRGVDASVSSGDWIAHGLVTTPTIVLLTTDANVNVYVNDKNATHFQVGVSAGTHGIYWYAEYNP